VVVVTVVEGVRGRSLTAALGNYSVTSNGGYRLWPIVKWLVLHVAELDLYLWVLPFAALIVLVANARHLDRPLRVFAAAASALAVWLVLEVAVFASRYSLRIEERNLFYLAPIFLVALLAWIERGQPRPPRAAVVAAGLAAALPGAIPFGSLLNITSQSDTLGFQPWWFLGDAWAGRDSIAVVVVLVSVALAAAFLWLPRRYAPVLPVLVALGFLATWLPLELWTHSFPRLGASAAAQGIGGSDKSWIDRAVGRNAHVGVLWTGDNPLAVWENEFWNRSVRTVYDLTTPLGGDMPSTRVTVDRSSGVLRTPGGQTIAEPYMLTHTGHELVGRVVARDPATGMLLYRAARPVRSTESITGLYAEKASPWSNGNPVWTRYQCRGGTYVVVVRSDAQLFRGAVQTVRVTGTTPARVFRVPPSTDGIEQRFPLSPHHGVCRVAFSITPTRRPVDYPRLHNPDPRPLGLHFDVQRYVPPR